MLYSFAFFLAAFIAVGLFSAKFRKNTVGDYLLASKDIKPWMAGFSLFATENSGWMFVGYIGLAYTVGLSAIWVLIGWYFGEVLILSKTAKQVRQKTQDIDAHTYAGLLSNWHGAEFKWIRRLCALLTIIFLSTYAGAQLNAGGKALNVLMGIDLQLSAVIGFVMVVAYCWAGGIRATIWTDAIQSIVMLGSLIMILAVSLMQTNGLNGLLEGLSSIDPDLTAITSDQYKFGFLLFVIGWLFSGFGIMGQPHLMVRFMVLDNVKNTNKVLVYYAFLVGALTLLTTFSAMAARLLVAEAVGGDPELALPTLAVTYLPDVFAGLFLAGLFAAAMSTADSLVLSSSAALTRDLARETEKPFWSKMGTLAIAILALGIALFGNDNVFQLVTFAWSIMAASFTPLLFVYCFNQKVSQPQAIFMVLGGVGTALWWDQAGLSGDIYNAFPGIVAGFVLFGLFKITGLFGKK